MKSKNKLIANHLLNFQNPMSQDRKVIGQIAINNNKKEDEMSQKGQHLRG